MALRTLYAFTRPASTAILFSNTADKSGIDTTCKLCSQIWGGSCSLWVHPKIIESLPINRPDVLYWLSDCDEQFKQSALYLTNSKHSGPLTVEYATNLWSSESDRLGSSIHLPAALPVAAVSREKPTGEFRLVTDIICSSTSPMYPYLATIFGVVDDRWDISPFHRRPVNVPDSAQFHDVLGIIKDHILANSLTIYELGMYGLTRQLRFFSSPPTFVIVGDICADLALYWNIRTNFSDRRRFHILPIPLESLDDPKTCEALKFYLTAISKYSTYMEIASISIPNDTLVEVQKKILNILPIGELKSVDIATHRICSVPTCAEAAQLIQVDINENQVVWSPPRLQVPVSSSKNYSRVVEFGEDTSTGRAILEVLPPFRHSMSEILNGADPPRFPGIYRPRVTHGRNGLSVLCDERDRIESFCLPSAKEIVHTLLEEAGISIKSDEKCSIYEPAIDSLGGIQGAATAFTGERYKVIKTLLTETPKSRAEILGLAKLGNGKFTQKQDIGEDLVKYLPRWVAKVSKTRWEKYTQNEWPAKDLDSLLHNWSQRKVVQLFWRLPKCRRCMQTHDVIEVNLNSSIPCPSLQLGNFIKWGMPIIIWPLTAR